MAMLRMPTSKSNGKANLHQGAMGIGIELGKGILSEGYYKGKFTGFHPDSGNSFEGINLPQWDKILDTAVRTAMIIPLKYLGVDIILDEKKGPLVIEVNARPGWQIQNVNRMGLKQIMKLTAV